MRWQTGKKKFGPKLDGLPTTTPIFIYCVIFECTQRYSEVLQDGLTWANCFLLFLSVSLCSSLSTLNVTQSAVNVLLISLSVEHKERTYRNMQTEIESLTNMFSSLQFANCSPSQYFKVEVPSRIENNTVHAKYNSSRQPLAKTACR